MSTMLAAVLHDFNDLRLEQLPIPEPKDFGDVLVRVKSCGICATDYKAIVGRRRNVGFPFDQGHEASGLVAAVGPGVCHVRAGDEVIVQPLGHCGHCPACRLGNTHHCQNAFVLGGDGPDDVRDGAFAEYVLTKESTLYAKPPAISWGRCRGDRALGGGLERGHRAQPHATRRGRGGHWRRQHRAVVHDGCQGGRRGAAGGGRYEPKRPGPGQAPGATATVNPQTGEAKQQIDALLPRGPDLVVEAAGSIEAVRLMVALRRRGTRGTSLESPPTRRFELDGGLTHFLEGRQDASFGTTTVAMANAIRLMETGLVNPEPIISHRFPLAEIHAVLAVMASPDHNKIILHP